MQRIETVISHDGSIREVNLFGARTWLRDRTRPYPLDRKDPDGWFDHRGVRYYFEAVLRSAEGWIMQGRDSIDASGSRVAYNDLTDHEAATLLRIMKQTLPKELESLRAIKRMAAARHHQNAVCLALDYVIEIGRAYLRRAAIPGYLDAEDTASARSALNMLVSSLETQSTEANWFRLINKKTAKRCNRMVGQIIARGDWIPTNDDLVILSEILHDFGGPPQDTKPEPVRREKLIYRSCRTKLDRDAIKVRTRKLALKYGGKPEDYDETCLLAPDGTKGSDVPTHTEVQELSGVVDEFINKLASSPKHPFDDEDYSLPCFLRVANALDPLKRWPEHAEGWPQKTGRAVFEIRKVFEAIVNEWGWKVLLTPEPERLQAIKKFQNWYREKVVRPMYEAAVSWQVGFSGIDYDPDIDERAEEGRALGFGPTMTFEEGRQWYHQAEALWLRTPCIGIIHPELKEEHKLAIRDAARLLEDALDEAAKGCGTGNSDHDEASKMPHEESPISESMVPTNEAAEEVIPERETMFETVQIALRRKNAPTQSALWDFMKDRSMIACDKVGDQVHGDSQTSDEAIRKNVERLNKSLITLDVPIAFSVRAGHVIKDEYPL